MIGVWVRVRVKPERRQAFLDAIEVDALGSEGDEPGCVRFNVLQDTADENVYYFYEVYRDREAQAAHRETEHYAVWRAARDALDGPTERVEFESVFPAADAYWERSKQGR